MVYNATFSSHLTQYTDEAVTEMAEDGHKHVMELAPGFVADFLETLDELGNELEEESHEAAGETLTCIPCPVVTLPAPAASRAAS